MSLSSEDNPVHDRYDCLYCLTIMTEDDEYDEDVLTWERLRDYGYEDYD